MSRRDSLNRARESADSPFYTPAPYIPGQMTMPVGYVHSCPKCGNDYICDSERCSLGHKHDCADCSGIADSHKMHPWNMGPLPHIERPEPCQACGQMVEPQPSCLYRFAAEDATEARETEEQRQAREIREEIERRNRSRCPSCDQLLNGKPLRLKAGGDQYDMFNPTLF